MKPSTISCFFCILLVVILYRYFTYYHNESDDVLKYKRVVYDYRNVTKVMAAGNHVGDELRSVQSAQVGLPSAIIPPKKNMTLTTTKLEKSVNTNKQGKTVQYNQNTNSTEDPNVKVKPLNKVSSLKTTRPATPSKSSKVFAIGPDCSDQQWCTVKIPQNSHFRFDPPTDTSRWRRAQIQAANGEQVLLQRILKLFPQILDFLDGDLLFRQYHKISDVFLDNKGRSFEALTASSKSSEYATKESMHLFKNGLPGPYDFRWAGRAPIVKLGYLAFDKSGSFLFNGKVIGEGHLGRDALLQQWKLYRSDIDTPFIALHSSNENWGLLSTHFPNRTENLGWCCSPQDLAAISDMLDDSKLLMMLVNQHTNVTHPKLLTLPRGLPIYKENQKQLIWDSMRSVLHTTKKSVLVSTGGAQNKASREQVISCVAKKFSRSDATSSFKVDVGSVEQQQQQQLTANEYLKSLGAARFSLALPGQGYDTFRSVFPTIANPPSNSLLFSFAFCFIFFSFCSTFVDYGRP